MTVADDAFGHAAEEYVLQACVPVSAHDDQFEASSLGECGYFESGWPLPRGELRSDASLAKAGFLFTPALPDRVAH